MPVRTLRSTQRATAKANLIRKSMEGNLTRREEVRLFNLQKQPKRSPAKKPTQASQGSSYRGGWTGGGGGGYGQAPQFDKASGKFKKVKLLK